MGLKSYKVNLDKLREKKANKEASKGKSSNVDFFNPKLINNKKTTFVLRFLPNIHNNGGDSEPWLPLHYHFKNKKNESAYTICPLSYEDKSFKDCPFCEESFRIKNASEKGECDSVETAVGRNLYRSFNWAINVLIVEDPRDKDSNQQGEVVVWKFGRQVQEVLFEMLYDEGKDFCDPMNGNNFNLVLKPQGDNPNYQSSNFNSITQALTEDDDELDIIEKKIKDLSKLCLPKVCPSYDELDNLLNGKKNVSKETSNKTESKKEKVETEEDDLDEILDAEESVNTPVEINDDEEDEEDLDDILNSVLDDE